MRRALRTWRALALGWAVALAGCGGASPTPDDARPRFDEAMRLELAGDALGAQEVLLALAHSHPETPHGQAARRRIQSGLAESWVSFGVVLSAGIPVWVATLAAAERPQADENPEQEVDRLYDAVVAYYYADHSTADGTLRPARLPESTPELPGDPTVNFCGGAGEMGEDVHEAPAWKALGFQPAPGLQLSYQVVVEGDRFTVVVRADPHCLGIVTRYERSGEVDEAGNIRAVGGLSVHREEP